MTRVEVVVLKDDSRMERRWMEGSSDDRFVMGVGRTWALVCGSRMMTRMDHRTGKNNLRVWASAFNFPLKLISGSMSLWDVHTARRLLQEVPI